MSKFHVEPCWKCGGTGRMRDGKKLVVCNICDGLGTEDDEN